MSEPQVIIYEDGAGGFLTIAPVWDEERRRRIETKPATGEEPAEYRAETDDEVIARNLRFVPDGAEWHAFPASASDADIAAKFPAYAVKALEAARAKALAGLSAKRIAAENNFSWGGRALDGGERTQMRLTGAVVSMLAPGAPAERKWMFPNGDLVAMSAQDLIAMGQALAAHVQACVDKHAALKFAVLAASTRAELDAIEVDTGWPDGGLK